MKALILLLLFLCSWSNLYSQEATTTTISGTITDAKSGESLPFVDVYWVGTDIGTTSDINGNYSLSNSTPTDSIGFAFLGYQKKHIRINSQQEQSINVQLQEASNELITATVTAVRKKLPKDTAAIALWRKVVLNRATNNIDHVEGYTFQDYVQTGFDLYNPDPKIINMKILQKPFGIVHDYIRTEKNGDPYLPFLMKETIREVKYQKQSNKKKVKIVADRFSGMDNPSLSDFIGNELEGINPYQDMIILTGKSFVSPFAATGNLSYNYFITDSVKRDGDQYYLLTFVGKTKQDFTFLGAAWIHDPSAAIESIEMEISPHINLNFIKKLHILQYYESTPDRVWMKTREDMVARLAIDLFDFGSRKNKKKKNEFRIRKKLTRHQIVINPAFEEDDFKVEDLEFAEKSAELSDEAWDDLRPIKLDSISRGTYEMVDSITRTKFYKTMDYLLYTMITSHLKAGPIEFGEYPEFVSWNEIEGVRLKLGVRTTKGLSKDFQVHGFAAYGLKDKQWKYGAGFNWLLPSKNRKWNKISAYYENDFRMMGQRHVAMRHDNIMSSLSRRTPMSRLMKIREGSLSYERDWIMGLYSTVAYRWRRFYSVPGAFQFTQNDGEVKIPHFTTSEFIAKIHWGHKERFWVDNSGFKRASMGTKFPILELEYTAGIKGLFAGNHNYHKIDVNIRQRLNSILGYTKYKVELSRTFGEIPYPLMTVHLGNQSMMGNHFAYALMNEFEFVSDTYAALWVHHHFDGKILNLLPLIKKLKWRSLFIFKSLYGSVSDKNRNLYDMPQGVSAPNFYAEIGFGIENIFKIFRVDFMWRLTHLGNPDVRPFGVNFSIAPKF